MQIKDIYLKHNRYQSFAVQIKDYIKYQINIHFWGKVSDYPCYNSETIQTFPCLLCRIKDAPCNLLGVYFDEGVRDPSFLGEVKYTLTELKKMGNGAKTMYIFWQA